MTVINAQTKHGKRKVIMSKIKKDKAKIDDFANLSRLEKDEILADLLPALVELLEEQG